MGYAARKRYRRGSRLRRSVNRIVTWLAGVGLTPSNTIRLDVAGRKTGKVHAFAVTLAILHDDRYLVSLAGESDWVRNLRASGEAVIRHGNREEIHVRELPVGERARVLEAYLNKRALSKSPAAEARDYFGVDPHPSRQMLESIADYYPVFKVIRAINYER
jgi:deazaflavin-dependent oxidoreductase (nitroreductase family)